MHHNDSEMAVANSLIAVRQGAEMVQGTINGIERCGNANLVSIIANLQIKMGYKILAPKKMRDLSNLSHSIREFANLDKFWKYQPFVGKSAFAIREESMYRKKSSYEHLKLVGKSSSELSLSKCTVRKS